MTWDYRSILNVLRHGRSVKTKASGELPRLPTPLDGDPRKDMPVPEWKPFVAKGDIVRKGDKRYVVTEADKWGGRAEPIEESDEDAG